MSACQVSLYWPGLGKINTKCNLLIRAALNNLRCALYKQFSRTSICFETKQMPVSLHSLFSTPRKESLPSRRRASSAWQPGSQASGFLFPRPYVTLLIKFCTYSLQHLPTGSYTGIYTRTGTYTVRRKRIRPSCCGCGCCAG